MPEVFNYSSRGVFSQVRVLGVRDEGALFEVRTLGRCFQTPLDLDKGRPVWSYIPEAARKAIADLSSEYASC